MAIGKVISPTLQDGVVRAWVRVEGDSADGLAAVEYPVEVPRKHPDGTSKTRGEIEAEIVAGVQAQRRARVRPAPAPAAVSATLNIPD